jgi:HNH/Endo VII superfamily nuclease toxin with a HHH motif/Domain of unknown function (DUF4157)
MRLPIQTKTTSSLTPIQTGLLQRKCNSCGQHKFASGECTSCQPKRGLQRKLTIGASNDPLELEADRIADQVMAAPAHPTVGSAPPRIQRFTGQAAGQVEAAPPSVDRVLSSPGRPLERSLQQDMGQRFGQDFSRVRIHTDTAAERSAQEVNASAYTVGHNIVFGVGWFMPGNNDRQRLLAHELVHVVQQSDGKHQLLRQEVISDQPRSLNRNLDPSRMTDIELDREISLLRAWLNRQITGTPETDMLSHILSNLESEQNRRVRPTSRASSSEPSQPPVSQPSLLPVISTTSTPSSGATPPPIVATQTPLNLPTEGVDMPWVGKGSEVSSSDLGYLRNHEMFWSEFDRLYPGRLSPANLARVAQRQAPQVDAHWVSLYPQHAAYLGDTLEHHHVGQGSRAVPLPSRLHDAYTVFHPQRRVVGTPSGGTRAIPPQRTSADAQAELDRHVRAGRIQGPGIDPNAPPRAPSVPPASEVAALPAVQQQPGASAPAAPTTLSARLRPLANSMGLFGLTMIGAYFANRYQQMRDQQRFQEDMRRINPQIDTQLQALATAVTDLQIDIPAGQVYANITLRATSIRSVQNYVSPFTQPGEGIVDQSTYYGTELVNVEVSVNSRQSENSRTERTAPMFGFGGIQETTHTTIEYSIPLEVLPPVILRRRIFERLNATEQFAITSQSAKQEAATQGLRARLIARSAQLPGG